MLERLEGMIFTGEMDISGEECAYDLALRDALQRRGEARVRGDHVVGQPPVYVAAHAIETKLSFQNPEK
jgi:hypothetical protein